MKSERRSALRRLERMKWSMLLPILLASLEPGTVWAGVNEWTNVGPEGGIVRFLTVDPQDPSTLYAGTPVGVFKSEDRGENWRNAGLMGWIVGGLVIDPQNPTTVYALTQGHTDGYPATGVFKTTDGGATWNEADSGLLTNMLVDFTSPEGANSEAA